MDTPESAILDKNEQATFILKMEKKCGAIFLRIIWS